MNAFPSNDPVSENFLPLVMSSLPNPPQQRTQLVLNLLRQQDVRDTLPDLGVVRQSVARGTLQQYDRMPAMTPRSRN